MGLKQAPDTDDISDDDYSDEGEDPLLLGSVLNAPPAVDWR